MPSANSQLGEAENRKPCVACREHIDSQASVCPHCHSSQSLKKWKSIGEVLKWVGGIAAVVSLVMGVVQLRGVVKTMRERTQTVEELVRAADVQFDMADYAGALLLIEQALALEPGSRQARKLHLQVAMKWVRQFTGIEHTESRSFNRDDYSPIIDPLVPILHRGTADKNPSNAADVLAHIGWANHLRVIGGTKDLNPVEYFERSLAKDPANVFAHAMWATMCATYKDRSGCGDDRLETARKHYVEAVKSEQHREYVDDIRLKTLLLSPDRSAGVHVIDLVQEMRDSDTTMSMENKYGALNRIAELYMTRERFYKTETSKQTAGVKVRDALSAAEWLFEGIDYKKLNRQHRQWHHRVLMARLNELAGNSNKAIEMYRSTRLYTKRTGGTTFHIQTDIDKSLLQLLKIRRGSLGVRLQAINRQLAQSLGLPDTEGALVEEVTAGSGAEKAGIRVGDVILKVNGIGSKGAHLNNLLGLALAGDVVEVIVFRDGQQQALKVTLGERDPSENSYYYSHPHYDVAYLVDRVLYGAVYVEPFHGDVWLADLTDELCEAFEVDSGINGVVVMETWQSGLRVGRVITEVDQVQVSSTSKVVELVKDAQSSGKESIAITFLENGTRNTRAIRLASEEGK
jgi:S1-C subfamily serine protease